MAYRCIANLLGAWSHDAACAAAHADAFKQIVAPHISKCATPIAAPMKRACLFSLVLSQASALRKGSFDLLSSTYWYP
eukprot:6181196-Pleurochrysis_carterae.AAC.3